MKFSIITVCYNAQESIQATVNSVLSQTFTDYEYIIKDGGSTDGTLKLLENISAKTPIKVITEPDNGIYSAMNQALEYAQGEYVYFINCGDILATEDVLMKVNESMEEYHNEHGTWLDVMYGNMFMGDKNTNKWMGYADNNELTKSRIARGFTVCHQVVFARREIFRQKKFDETYKFWADQEWLMYVLSKYSTESANTGSKLSAHIVPVHSDIVYYDTQGVSSDLSNLDQIRKESDRITKKYAPFTAAILIPAKKVFRFIQSHKNSVR